MCCVVNSSEKHGYLKIDLRWLNKIDDKNRVHKGKTFRDMRDS